MYLMKLQLYSFGHKAAKNNKLHIGKTPIEPHNSRKKNKFDGPSKPISSIYLDKGSFNRGQEGKLALSLW